MKKCEKCFYYKLCTQHDYINEEKEESEITDNICGVYEEGIPKDIWEEKEECEDFIEDDSNKEESQEINIG